MVFFQKPNRESIFALCGFVFSFVTKGLLHFCAVSIFVIFGAIWGYMEITSGVNWFRKMLGVLAFVFILLFLLYQFHPKLF